MGIAMGGLGIQCSESKKPTPQSYLALGDSYTIGESVAENLRWPLKLVDSLNKSGVLFTPPNVIARTGWTTDELQRAINEATLEPPYDWVSLLIGVNNQYRGRTVENFKPEFRSLLEQSIHLAGNRADRVFVVSIPDWGQMPYAQDRNPTQIAAEIDAYNQASAQICRELNVLWINITPISRQVADHPEWIAADGLHPSGDQYAQWVAAIIPYLQDFLYE